MAKEYRHDIDVRHNKIMNAAFNPSASTPAGFVTGEFYLNTTDAHFHGHDGTSEKTVPFVGAGVGSTLTVGGTASAGTSGDAARVDHVHAMPALATTSVSGFMSAADKTLLSGATASNTASTLALRDANGRTQFADPSAAQDAATKNYVDTKSLSSFAVPTTDVSWNSKKITNLADPTNAQDAATKNYVDMAMQGLSPKQVVRAATIGANINLTSGAPNTLDGVTLVAGDRVLVKDQTTAAQNGLYVVTTLGTGSNGTWARSSDVDAWAELINAYTWVSEGTTLADTAWVSTVDAGGTLGTTPITWVQFSGAGMIAAGAGLTKTGNTLAANVDTTTIYVNGSNQIAIYTNGTNGGITHTHVAATNKDGAAGVPSMRTLGTGATQAAAGNHTHTGAFVRAFTSVIGDGTATSIPVTHGLATSRNLMVEVFKTATYETMDVEVVRTSTTVVTINCFPALAAGEATVVVHAL